MDRSRQEALTKQIMIQADKTNSWVNSESFSLRDKIRVCAEAASAEMYKEVNYPGNFVAEEAGETPKNVLIKSI